MDQLNGLGTDDMQEGVSSDCNSGFKDKKHKMWDGYKTVTVNGVVQEAECRYCHVRLSCKGDHLGQHRESCRAKEDRDLSQKTNLCFGLSNKRCKRKLVSKVWKDFVPIYGEGRLRAADCVHCHKRLSANGTTGHLRRHTQGCLARGGTNTSHQKTTKDKNDSLNHSSDPQRSQEEPDALSHFSVPSPKSRLQDNLSPALRNGKIQTAEYACKFLKRGASYRTPVDQHILSSPLLVKTEPMEQNTSSAQTAVDACGKFDQEASYQELTRMIILHGYPLSIVEHEGMRRFAKSLNPKFNMASSIDIEEYSTILFQKEKADLKRKIALSSHRVSLSACLWTSHGSDASMNYLCLSVHFIDSDWKLQRRIIKFDMFRSSASNLDTMIHLKEACMLDSASGPFSIIWGAIRDWNLDQKLFSLTSVGEIRNHEGIAKLVAFLVGRKCLPIGGKLYNIACVDDVLNDIVSEEQPVLHLVSDILDRFIKEQMSSSLTQQQLKEIVTHISLKRPEEDAKWWHIIYFGLEVLLRFKKTFPSNELLSAKDTKTIESVWKILRAFYHATEVISGHVCPTANVYFNEIWKVRTTLQEEACTDHTELASMVSEMQRVFNGYWQNSFVWLSIPVVLDPRFKISFIEFRLTRAFGTYAAYYVSAVRDTIQELFLEYCSALYKPSADTSNLKDCYGQEGGLYSDSLEDWDEHQTRSQRLKELDSYLDDGLIPRKDDFDILNWWMSNSKKYPTLSIMAGDILAMPASALHCETALGNNGPMINKQWSLLNIKTIEALVCTRDWIK